MKNKLPMFWSWLLYGNDAAPGYRRVIDWWIPFHISVGIFGTSYIGVDLASSAQATLLPLMAIFVGLTFSWAGNAHSLLQSAEIVKFSKARRGGIAEYVFTFQLSILIILITVILWIIPALKFKYLIGYFLPLKDFNILASIFLYALLSLSFRTSWQAVLGANMLLLVRSRILGEHEELD